ncbi:hypothetical protein PAPYR_4940 [Paratrimastix pyriformis]|uniref:F-box domain-containing protein n=1 Tax=Paratrimastix pyriformis TaxID=342808 RepID=A0ABQ8UNR2_9EUKA|nr:hypothetical protein PAPYR_4940 [Paratrimastix pyriformis]
MAKGKLRRQQLRDLVAMGIPAPKVAKDKPQSKYERMERRHAHDAELQAGQKLKEEINANEDVHSEVDSVFSLTTDYSCYECGSHSMIHCEKHQKEFLQAIDRIPPPFNSLESILKMPHASLRYFSHPIQVKLTKSQRRARFSASAVATQTLPVRSPGGFALLEDGDGDGDGEPKKLPAAHQGHSLPAPTHTPAPVDEDEDEWAVTSTRKPRQPRQPPPLRLFANLPPELFGFCLSTLPLVDLLRLMAVSRTMQEIINSPAVLLGRTRLDLAAEFPWLRCHDPLLLELPWGRLIRLCGPALRWLKVTPCTPALFQLIVRSCPSLEHLNVAFAVPRREPARLAHSHLRLSLGPSVGPTLLTSGTLRTLVVKDHHSFRWEQALDWALVMPELGPLMVGPPKGPGSLLQMLKIKPTTSDVALRLFAGLRAYWQGTEMVDLDHWNPSQLAALRADPDGWADALARNLKSLHLGHGPRGSCYAEHQATFLDDWPAQMHLEHLTTLRLQGIADTATFVPFDGLDEEEPLPASGAEARSMALLPAWLTAAHCPNLRRLCIRENGETPWSRLPVPEPHRPGDPDRVGHFLVPPQRLLGTLAERGLADRLTEFAYLSFNAPWHLEAADLCECLLARFPRLERLALNAASLLSGPYNDALESCALHLAGLLSRAPALRVLSLHEAPVALWVHRPGVGPAVPPPEHLRAFDVDLYPPGAADGALPGTRRWRCFRSVHLPWRSRVRGAHIQTYGALAGRRVHPDALRHIRLRPWDFALE